MKKFILKSIFWIILVFSIFLIFSKYLIKPFDFWLTNMPAQINVITVGIEYSNKQDYPSAVCLNQYCIPTSRFSSKKSCTLSFFKKLFGQNRNASEYAYIDKYSVAIPYENKDSFEKNIANIFIMIGENRYYFTKDEFLKFKKERKNTDIIVDETGKTQTRDCIIYHLPNSIPSNFNGLQNTVICWFLSLFSGNCYEFIPAFIGFLICAIIYSLNRNLFNFKFEKLNHKTIILMILGLAIILRYITCINSVIFLDEIYTKNVATSSLLSCFQDPGNPPLFNILEYLISKILGNSILVYRILPFIFSILFVIFSYIFFKKINKSFALLIMFLASVNIYSVSFSSVLRSVTMCIFLTTALAYFLIKYLKTKENKDFIVYCILAICAINTHYFLVFYVAGNFFWGIFKLFNHKKELKKFIIANVLCGLTFIPYLLISFTSAVEEDFNSHISPLDYEAVADILNGFFCNKLIFFIFAIITILFLIASFLPKEKLEKYNIKLNKELRNIFLYLIYSITFVILTGAIISLLIKPIMNLRILYSIYGIIFLYFGVIIHTIFDFNLENKKIFCFKALYTLIIMFLFSCTIDVMEHKVFRNIDNFIFYIEKDMPKYIDKGYEIQVFVPYSKKIVNDYSFLKDKKEIKLIVTNNNNTQTSSKITNKVLDEAIEASKKGKKIIIYGEDVSFGTLNSYEYTQENAVVFSKGAIIKFVFN